MSTNEPTAAKRAALDGDAATGKIGATPMTQVQQDTLPHAAQNPGPAHNDPHPASTEHEDAGWTPEEPGSILSYEREGVPGGDTSEGDVPEGVGDSYTRTRAQTPLH